MSIKEIDQLDSSPYLVSFDERAKDARAKFRDEIEAYVEMLGANNAVVCDARMLADGDRYFTDDVVKDTYNAERYIVLIGDETDRIPNQEHLIRAATEYRNALKKLAKAQKKKATIGDRITHEPVFIDGNNYENSIVADRVDYRFQAAYRGGQITYKEAETKINDKLEKAMNTQIQNAKRNNQKRIEKTQDKILELKGYLEWLQRLGAIITNNDEVRDNLVIKYRSGYGLKLTARNIDERQSISMSPKSLFTFIKVSDLEQARADYVNAKSLNETENGQVLRMARSRKRTSDLETIAVCKPFEFLLPKRFIEEYKIEKLMPEPEFALELQDREF